MVANIYGVICYVFLVLFFSLFVLYVCNNSYTVMGGHIDGLWPTWQPAIIYTFIIYYMYISSLANKIVVVVMPTSVLRHHTCILAYFLLSIELFCLLNC